jgi:Methyltransferase domain
VVAQLGRRAYNRVRLRLWKWKHESLAPAVLNLGVRMVPTTAAVLEYPFQPASRWGWGRPPHAGLTDLFGRHEEDYRRTIDGLDRYLPQLAGVGRQPSPGQPCWDNGYWTGLDAVLHYGFLVERRPRTYLEVGSGFSTLFARRAIRDYGLATTIVSVDPHPRADVDAACDEMHRRPLEQADLSIFDRLEAGDVVLLDGTHTVFMNSDTAVAFVDVLPRLPKGVLVGIHDIFLPWDYPPEWTGRWYGEQFLVAALLLGHSPDWVVRFPAWYVSKHPVLAELLGDVWGLVGDPPGKTGSSLWIERV